MDADDFERCHRRGFMDAHQFLNPAWWVRRTRVSTVGCPLQDDRGESSRRGVKR